MKTLVAGWFSFEEGHATAGDLLSRDVACEWLERAGHRCDIAVAPPFRGSVDWRQVDPADYSHVVFVCGPFQQTLLETEFLNRFAGCRLIGLNLSMREPLSKWNPFDLLLERDSSEGGHPDLAFLSPPARVPIVGVCLVEPHKGGLVALSNEAIHGLVRAREVAVVEIDTRLDVHSTNRLRSPAEIESLISRVDVLLTTRLHGMVLALKNGVPPLVIDPKPGGAKICRQAELLGWPASFVADELDNQAIQSAFEYCLTDASRAKARQCSEHAQRLLCEMREEFVAEMRYGDKMEERYNARMSLARREECPKPPAPVSHRSTWASASWWHKLRRGWNRMRDRNETSQ